MEGSTSMKRRIRFKSVLANTSIVLLCMSACAFFVYLYVKDVHHSSVRTDKDEVAPISFKYRIAQRKYADRVVWEPLSNNSPL